MKNASIEARLRKLERRVEAKTSEPWVWVITENDDELPSKLAEMETAGTYKPGWNIVHWRIVNPPPRDRGSATHSNQTGHLQ